MSRRDKELLQQLALRHSAVGAALGVTRQAVSRGINSDIDYLNEDRLAVLYRRLQSSNPIKAKQLLDYTQGRDGLEARLQLPTVRREANDPTDTDFLDMWVLSQEPQEAFDPSYFDAMKLDHYLDPSKFICYLVLPGNVSNIMISLLRQLADAHGDLARIVVAESTCVALLPTVVIMRATASDDYLGLVQVEDWHFSYLPVTTTKRIFASLRAMALTRDTRASSNIGSGAFISAKKVLDVGGGTDSKKGAEE